MLRTVAAAMLVLLLVSCTGKEGATDKKTLAVSIEPQRYVLEQLVDSTYSVVTLLSRGANPETFDPSVADREKVERSAVYFSTGVLPFEHIIEESSSTPVVGTSDGVELIYGTHAHAAGEDCGHHHDADPHYWSSVSGMKAMARRMAQTLSELSPAESDAVARRLRAYEQHLDSLDAAVRIILEGRDGAAFAVWHPSLSYVARDYGLRQITLGVEGKDLSAKGLRQVIDKAKENNVAVFFFQKEYDSRQSEAVSSGMGTRVVEINPLEYDWESQLITIANEISRP